MDKGCDSDALSMKATFQARYFPPLSHLEFSPSFLFMCLLSPVYVMSLHVPGKSLFHSNSNLMYHLGMV